MTPPCTTNTETNAESGILRMKQLFDLKLLTVNYKKNRNIHVMTVQLQLSNIWTLLTSSHLL